MKESCRIRFKTCVKMRMVLNEGEKGAKCKDRWMAERGHSSRGRPLLVVVFCNWLLGTYFAHS